MSVGAYVWYTLGLACVLSSLTICLSLSPLLQNGRVQNTFSTHITTIQYTKISWDSPRHFFALETASNQRVGKRSRCTVPVMVKIATCHSSFGPPRIRVKSHLRLRLDLVKVCVQHLHGIVSFPTCVHTFVVAVLGMLLMMTALALAFVLVILLVVFTLSSFSVLLSLLYKLATTLFSHQGLGWIRHWHVDRRMCHDSLYTRLCVWGRRLSCVGHSTEQWASLWDWSSQLRVRRKISEGR